ncbi:hypothetical protein TWF694_006324 [Orbilia ellipsospora]|uniref:Uncharacterized protein n=1 Tax=Orbilia ellipsospora TaxID=2528407 RepID=A0AAV9XL69_9PEZI
MVLLSKLSTLLSIFPSLLLAHPAAEPDASPPGLGSHGTVPKELAARWDGDIGWITYGDGWCTSFGQVPIYSKILWKLGDITYVDFENSGLWYGRNVGGKWTVEIKRVVVNNGYSDQGYIQDAWNTLKAGTFQYNNGAYSMNEHAMASIGQYGGDGTEATRIEIWVTDLTAWAPYYYQVLKRDGEEGELEERKEKKLNGTTYGNHTFPNIKIDDEFLEKHVWKGPDPHYLAILNGTAPRNPPVKAKPKPKTGSKLSKRTYYWDSCGQDDDNMEYYNLQVDNSVGDCMWEDDNNQYWSPEKASFSGLWQAFPCPQNKNLCCNGLCTRSGNGCCPYGYETICG